MTTGRIDQVASSHGRAAVGLLEAACRPAHMGNQNGKHRFILAIEQNPLAARKRRGAPARENHLSKEAGK